MFRLVCLLGALGEAEESEDEIEDAAYNRCADRYNDYGNKAYHEE